MIIIIGRSESRRWASVRLTQPERQQGILWSALSRRASDLRWLRALAPWRAQCAGTAQGLRRRGCLRLCEWACSARTLLQVASRPGVPGYYSCLVAWRGLPQEPPPRVAYMPRFGTIARSVRISRPPQSWHASWARADSLEDAGSDIEFESKPGSLSSRANPDEASEMPVMKLIR